MLLVLAVLGFILGLVVDLVVMALASRVVVAANPARTAAPWDRLRRAATSRSLLRRSVTGVLLASMFVFVGMRYSEPLHMALALSYATVLVACAACDLYTLRVPNAITYPAIACALAIGLALPEIGLASVLLGGFVGATVLLVPALLTGGIGFGVGDAKLAAFAGFALGIENLVLALVVMALLGGLVAGVLLLTGLARKGEAMPYGPYISVGALSAILWRGMASGSIG